MKKYKIADLTVELNCGDITMRQAEKYAVTDCNEESDLSITTFDDFIVSKIGFNEVKTPYKKTEDPEIHKYLAEGKAFYRKLISDFNGMMLHASAVVVDEKAYIFSAESGTGKSTHTELWLKKFGDKAYILNDDKPAIRIFEDGVYAYGTPWSGKHDISVNKKVSIAGICFLERDTVNRIELMDSKKAIINFFNASIRKINQLEMLKLLETIDTILKKVPVYKMGCNPTMEAADMAYNAMCK